MRDYESIMELRGRDLDLAIALAMGYRWVWARVGYINTPELCVKKAILAKPGQYEGDSIPDFIDLAQTEQPTDESDRFFGWDEGLPYYHKSLRHAWVLTVDQGDFTFEEEADILCASLWPRRFTMDGKRDALEPIADLNLMFSDFNGYAETYATARCLLWLMVQEES